MRRRNTERDDLSAEAQRLRGEIDRLVAALASGVESPTIAAVVGQREKRLNEVRARLEVLAVAPAVLDLEVRRLEKEAHGRLREFQALLTRNVVERSQGARSAVGRAATLRPCADKGRSPLPDFGSGDRWPTLHY